MNVWSANAKEEYKMQEVDAMTKEEQATMLIDVFTDLRRIKGAEDRDKEIVQ